LDLVGGVIDADLNAVAPDEALVLAGQALEEFETRPEVVRLLNSAIAVLRNEDVLWDTLRPIGGGESRFCDTERLWEVALLSALREQLDGTALRAELHPLASSGTTLFPGGGPQLDPDIVIYDGAQPSGVVDAKYKVGATADAGDVYQIFGYAERLEARVGILCYVSPGESWTRELGTSPSGATFWAFGVSASDVLGALFTIAAEARGALQGLTIT